jgi:hypothetical protein
MPLNLDRQLVQMDLEADDAVADEVLVVTFYRIIEMLAESECNESLDLGAGTRRTEPGPGARSRHAQAVVEEW